MSQGPLAPPPQTGQPIDSWLYLLWRRLTATGQMLWSSIVPGSSADVAAVVTDETGSPGSLVFSGNPTLQGVTVDGVAYYGDTTLPVGVTLLNALFSTNTASGNNVVFRKCNNGVNTPNFTFAKGRGTAASPAAVQANDGLGAINFYGYDGTNYVQAGYLVSYVDGTVSTGAVPSRVSINVNSAVGASTEAFAISSSQVVTLGGVSTAPALKVTPVGSQARWIEVTGATASGNPILGVSGGILAISASVAITGVVSTSGYTVATLPAGTVGQRTYVTDALAPAYGVAVAGGGAVTIPVFYNGAAWICA